MQATKPRTQRKRLFQAPAHRRHKHFSAPLSPDLKDKHGTNSIPVRVGDTVRVLRGDRKGFEGKVTQVNRKKYRIFVDGVAREKVDGTSIPIPIHPSKVMIVTLNLDDKWRREAVKRKGRVQAEERRPTAEALAEEEAANEKPEIARKPATKKAVAKPRKKSRRKASDKPSSEQPKKTRKTAKAKRRTAKKKAEPTGEAT